MKKNTVNYSFIIPHKNNSLLLKRCIDSIPKQEDIEIIVVDDDSSEDHKTILRGMENITLLIDYNNSKGAGYARNIGLSKAQGKWIFFIDADDTFDKNISNLLYDILEIKEDVVYYNYSIISSHNKMFSACKYITEEVSASDILRLKYKITAPWNKAVKKDFLINNKILFEECLVGNDVLFSYQVGYFVSDNFLIINKPVYNYYIHQNSIVHKKKNDENYYLTICSHVYQMNSFFDSIGLHAFKRSIFIQFGSILLKKGISQFILAIKVFVVNYKFIIKHKNAYVDYIKRQNI